MLARNQNLPTPPRRAPQPAAARPGSRAAFTLVELLVVIVILGILVALVLPAIGRARRNATEARVVVEIKQLETAITGFKTKYGIEPPSRMVIYNNASDWNSDPASKAVIRRMWPQFDFAMTGGSGNAYPASWIFPKTMKAGECLMFFLGGVIEDSTTKYPSGFAKNPAYPFAPPSKASSREPAFMEFDINRIRDLDNSGSFEYYDPIPDQSKPYLYFNAYEAKGYRVTTPAIDLPTNSTDTQFLFLRDVYRVSGTAGATPPATPQATASGSQLLPAHKAQSYQIISPGYDGEYGYGGVFNPELQDSGLTTKEDFDNLTNFHGGRLKAD